MTEKDADVDRLTRRQIEQHCLVLRDALGEIFPSLDDPSREYYWELLDEVGKMALQSLSQEAVRDEALGDRLPQGEFERRHRANWEAMLMELHPVTAILVRDFSLALAHKLLAAEKKYGYSDGWIADDWMDECRAKLREHVEKGDPRDVAAYCAFLWYHKESTALKREPNAATQAGQEFSSAPSHEGHAAGPAPAAPDVASMVKNDNAPYVAWLIEYRDPKTGHTTGYLKDIDRDGTFDVILTRDAHKAIKFPDRGSAQAILDDTSFVHAIGNAKDFFVADHMFNCG